MKDGNMKGRRLLSISCWFIVLVLAGCDVDKIQKANSDDYVLIKKTELEQLKQQAELGRAVGRFREFRDGFRTWRLDTATGKTCIMLTTDYDWSHGAKDQPSCTVEDYWKQQPTSK
jgi:hypothetical protein